ncbi:MAG: hypothetical protein HQL07_13515 [Nitrospirae bacterium]|nr:hypothetical protein [Magnetococcales bacterium]HAT50616.1 hypothetical protein [Alphaproteobacteria bacterium]
MSVKVHSPVDDMRLVVFSFAGVMMAGTILLILPWSASAPLEHPISWLDALFTTTSAVCVTGLSTIDVGRDVSFFGQVVILITVQIGGLGVMTFTNFFIAVSGRNLSFMQRALIEKTHGTLPSRIKPATLLRDIFLFTLVLEGIGAILLTLRFNADYPLREAVWMGIFHSISAFCNAGFGLFSDSLMRYRNDVTVNLTIMGLIVTGGLGFVVFSDVLNGLTCRRDHRPAHLTLHSRMVLMITAILISTGAIFFFMIEYGKEAMGSDMGSSILASLFLSITTRTAGFNTIDTAHLTAPTIFLVIMFMAVGGSPGSTAGGMKTTTLGTLLAVVWSRVRNRQRVEFLNRSLSDETVRMAMFTFVAFYAVATAGFFGLLLSETGTTPYDPSHDRSLALLFETVSALATVGLSAGVTSGLSDGGKWIIIGLMYVGRIGPLILGMSLMGHRPSKRFTLPNESITIG